jgi:pentatricopeptide repeat protein
LRAAGVPPNEVTWNTLLKAHANKSDLAGALAVMKQMRDAGVPPNEVTLNMLFKCHSNCAGERLSSAKDVALHIAKDGVTSYA